MTPSPDTAAREQGAAMPTSGASGMDQHRVPARTHSVSLQLCDSNAAFVLDELLEEWMSNRSSEVLVMHGLKGDQRDYVLDFMEEHAGSFTYEEVQQAGVGEPSMRVTKKDLCILTVLAALRPYALPQSTLVRLLRPMLDTWQLNEQDCKRGQAERQSARQAKRQRCKCAPCKMRRAAKRQDWSDYGDSIGSPCQGETLLGLDLGDDWW